MMTESVTPPPVQNPDDKSDVNSAKTGMPPVVLKGDVKIYPNKPISFLNKGPIKAYEASGANGSKAFAMICEKNLVPQTEIIHKYAEIVTPYLPKVIAAGVADWPMDSREHLIMVYEDKLGQPIIVDKNPQALGLKPELVIGTIFKNILDVVQAMRDKGIAHGNICVQNIFDGGSPTYEHAVLGEMLSAPSGFNQPILYETINRSLCQPIGRGSAEIADDIYALGVTLATLIRTSDPTEGLSHHDIIHAKMDLGSFNFIVGKSRFPALILEFLRGTLNDDVNLRWTFDDIMVWAEGRRVNPKQSGVSPILKASRPMEFSRQKFLKPQLLAVELPRESSSALSMIENGELFLWINRSIQNKELEKRYEEAISEAKRDTSIGSYADKLAAMMAISLEPTNPIFYKSQAFNPSGFSNVLVDCMALKKDVNVLVEVIQSNIFQFWNKHGVSLNANIIDVVNKLGNCQTFLTQAAIGSGLERCIYSLSFSTPCLSEKLSDFYVRSADHYLRALEKMSTSKNRPEWFLDRHIVAFLSVRDKTIIEPFIPDIGANERYRQRLGVLKMLAAIQVRDKVEAVPGVTNWIAGMLDVLIDRFHDREKRKRVKAQIEKLKGQGNLEKMAALFGNFEEIQLDARNYAEMLKQYQALKKEYALLDFELQNNKNFGIDMGKQVATVVSASIAGLVVLIYLGYAFMKSGGAQF
jgi:hypothetical protein